MVGAVVVGEIGDVCVVECSARFFKFMGCRALSGNHRTQHDHAYGREDDSS